MVVVGAVVVAIVGAIVVVDVVEGAAVDAGLAWVVGLAGVEFVAAGVELQDASTPTHASMTSACRAPLSRLMHRECVASL
jgi:hypothetical protein